MHSAPGAHQVQRLYNALFPYYAEVCVVTQLHQIGEKPGGWGGHAVMFIHGAEPDPGAGYPRLRLAAERAMPTEDSGTGVSVNRIFRNVNWVAIPGRDEFFRGGLMPDETLDEARFEGAIRKAAAAGWFDGIRIAEALESRRRPEMPLEEFIVRRSVGTDFALTFARTAYGARLPLTRATMGRVIDYLNAINERARRIGYTWNAYTNNCSHVLHNALAAAGVWDPKAVRGTSIVDLIKDLWSVARAVTSGGISDFAFPANSFVRTYEAGNERPIDDALTAFRNHDVARTVEDGWLSTGAGALIVTYPMHDGGRNLLFARGHDAFLFSVPLVWDKKQKFVALTRDPAPDRTELGANLGRFRDRYARALSRRSSAEAMRGDGGDHELRDFSERLYAVMAAQLRETETRLAEYRREAGSALSAS